MALRQPGLLFLAIPFDSGWTLTANGRPVQLYPFYSSLQGALLMPGPLALRLRFEDAYCRW